MDPLRQFDRLAPVKSKKFHSVSGLFDTAPTLDNSRHLISSMLIFMSFNSRFCVTNFTNEFGLRLETQQTYTHT